MTFASTEQGIILNSKIDYKGTTNASDDIDAKVYLLSKSDVENMDATISNLTDYSKSQGGTNNGVWWLRTPLRTTNFDYNNAAVYHCPLAKGGYYVDRVEGIVPAIQITY